MIQPGSTFSYTPPPSNPWGSPEARQPGYGAEKPTAPGTLRILFHHDGENNWNALSRLPSAYSRHRAIANLQGSDTLTLSTGDNMAGRNPQDWELNTLLQNLMGLTHQVPGNHELDQGVQQYASQLPYQAATTLATNWQLPTSQPNPTVNAQVITGRHGTYGLLGVTTPAMDRLVDDRAPGPRLPVMSLEQTMAAVQKIVRQMESQGVNRIILLSHLGMDEDRRLAQSVSGVDVIVGGHSKEAVSGVQPGNNWVSSPSNEPVLLLHAGDAAHWYGVADLVFNQHGHLSGISNTLLPTQQEHPHPTAQTLASRPGTPAPMPLGFLATPIWPDHSHHTPHGFLQYVADTARTTTGAHMALINSNALRGPLYPGPLNNTDLLNAMPFEDRLVTVSMTGAEILSLLQQSASALAQNRPYPGMFHTSGLDVVMDQQTGSVVQATIQGMPLNPNAVYTVALEDHTLNNMAKYPAMASVQQRNALSAQQTGPILRNLVVQHLAQHHQQAPQQPLNFTPDQRLTIR